MADDKELMRQVDNEAVEPDEWSPVLNYLQSVQGHELASRIVSLIEEIKRATLDRSMEQSRLTIELDHRYRRNSLILQSAVLVITIIAASFLTYVGKFDSTIGVLFGTLLGYFFGIGRKR